MADSPIIKRSWDKETAEVTWHGKGNEDKRGQPVEPDKIRDAWLYVGGQPLICSRQYPPVIRLQTSDDTSVTLIAHPVQSLETLVTAHTPHSDGSVKTT